MLFSPKFLIIVGLAAAVALVVFVVAAPILKLGEKTAEEGAQAGGFGQLPVSEPPQNAFLPAQSGVGGPVSPSNAGGFTGPLGITGPSEKQGLDNSALLPAKPQEPPVSEFQVKIPTIEDLSRNLDALLKTAPAEEEMLALPAVLDRELSINETSGVGSVLEYLEYFAKHQTEINFDYTKFQVLPKNDVGAPMLLVELLEKYFADNNFQIASSYLAVQREFIESKKNFLQSIPVRGMSIELGKKLIAFDKLTLELINRATAVTEGKTPKTELRSFYEKYLATATAYHEIFVKDSGLLSSKLQDNLFYNIAAALGLVKIAYAQLPFGGAITAAVPCACPPTGVNIFVGPPIGGSYYLTTPFMATPMFFPFKQSHPGAFILGLFTLTPMPCNFPIFCFYWVPQQVIMAGTSM